MGAFVMAIVESVVRVLLSLLLSFGCLFFLNSLQRTGTVETGREHAGRSFIPEHAVDQALEFGC